MNAIQRKLDRVIFVDANSDDYEALMAELDSLSVRIHTASTGESALRWTAAKSAVWIVNAQLPDMAGVALLAFVRRRVLRANVLLVGDEYSPIDELAARLAGATAYVCKPVSFAWLECYQTWRRSPDVRAGPPFL